MAVLVCNTCKGVFKGRSNKKYCSPECKRKAEMAARKRKRKKPVIPRRKDDWGLPSDWGEPTEWENLPDIKDAWGDLPEWGNDLPTWDEPINKPPAKGQKKGGQQLYGALLPQSDSHQCGSSSPLSGARIISRFLFEN